MEVTHSIETIHSIVIVWLLLVINFWRFSWLDGKRRRTRLYLLETHTHLVIVLIDVFVQFM